MRRLKLRALQRREGEGQSVANRMQKAIRGQVSGKGKKRKKRQHQVACWTHLKTVGSWLYELPLLTERESERERWGRGCWHYAS